MILLVDICFLLQRRCPSPFMHHADVILPVCSAGISGSHFLFPQNEPPLIWFQPFSHLIAQRASLNPSSRVSRVLASATHKVMFHTTASKTLLVVGCWFHVYMVRRFILYLTVYMCYLTGFQGFRTPWFHPCALKLTDYTWTHYLMPCKVGLNAHPTKTVE